MRLTLEITRTAEGKHHFRAYDDLDRDLEGISGCGWNARDAVDDFCDQVQRDLFFDDDTPIVLRREKISIGRRKFMMDL